MAMIDSVCQRTLEVDGNVTLPRVESGNANALPVRMTTAERVEPWVRLVPGGRSLVFLVHGSKLFEVPPALYAALAAGDAQALAMLEDSARPENRYHALGLGHVAPSRSPSALSLNLAQACNLGCHYCYADSGKFQGRARLMPESVAISAIDRLIDISDGARVTVGFIGGEPFLNRRTLHASVEHATRRARALGISIGFSVTTNATLLEPADIALLRDNAFAVTVSLDGDAVVHDRHRPTRNGEGSFSRAMQRLEPLLRTPGNARVAARASVTRDDLRVAARVSALLDAGLPEAGVSPVRTGPMARLALRPSDWGRYLDEMKRAAEEELGRIREGGASPAIRFSNLGTALREIHLGACRPLPCGAGANYASVSAEGGYYTCHRTIDDDRFLLGDREQGPSYQARRAFLERRHVDRQAPCRDCWARYLCGGGCHAEVAEVGRGGCDFIRGWLEHCLQVYADVSRKLPHLLDVWDQQVHRA